VPRLGEFLDQYLASRQCKNSTRLNLKQAIDNLVAFFGADKPLDCITPGDADDYRTWLTTSRQTPLSENTARRHCGRAKQCFKHAVRKRLIPASPFDEMTRLTVRGTPERRFFVERELIDRVLKACPSLDWRLIVVLCRYGGLRPSEACDLRWENIDWERSRMRIHCKKTEHHEGRAWREVPIFPEMAPCLTEAWEAAPDRAEMVVAGYRSTQNLGKLLKDIIVKAGVPVWVKPFQNMRSTRETELAHEYPLHVVCAWIGNSQAVAREHYLQVRDEDFARAAGGQQPGLSHGARPAAMAGRGGPKSGPASVGSGRGERQGVPASASPTSKNPALGAGCRSVPPAAASTVNSQNARERT
jgi:integrase